MAIAERLRPGGKPDMEKYAIPGIINERVKRGKARNQRETSKRNECWGFFRGEQWYWVDAKRQLIPDRATVNADGHRKPAHIHRTVRNLLVDVVSHEVAGAIQRVPGYETSPTTTEPEDRYAAWLAQKVAVFGYDKWDIRRITERVVTHAVVGDEGFAWPYFDNTVGPYIEDGIGEGEIQIRTFGANEVFWEPGVGFEESRWYAVEQARDIEDVMELDGFVGGPLNSDATKSEARRATQEDTKLVLVTDYLERPCPKYPEGRWITMANDRVIVEERPYPCRDGEGRVLDEPVLHYLYYISDPDSDRNMGLVRHLLDAQRTINGVVNRIAEWIQLALNPQLIIWNGGLGKGQRMTGEPGAVYNAYGSGKVEWRDVPPIPQELFQQKAEAEKDMDRIAGRTLTDPGQIESGKEAEAVNATDTSRRANFYANLATFHSRLMRHCLYLVQRHYTEDRLVKLQGRTGPDLIPSFRGAQLRGQADVRVDPASLVPRTKEGIRQEVMNIAQMFPGYFPPEVILSALNSGTAEKLIEGYELDVARANEVVQQIRLAPEALLAGGTRPVFPNEDAGPALDEMGNPIPVIDPATGQPRMEPDPQGEPPVVDPETGDYLTDPPMRPVYQKATEVPDWLPRPFDGIPIQKAVLEDFMKTRDYSLLGPEGKEAAHLYYAALLDIESKAAQRDAAIQTQMAEQQGMANATKPAGQKPMASLPSLPS